MKIKGKKAVAALSGVCILNLMAGCGASSALTAQVDEEAVKGADEVPAENEAGPDETQTNKTVGADDGQTADSAAGNDAALDGTVQAPDPGTGEAEGADAARALSNTEGRWHVLEPEVAAAVDADFEGVVYKIDADSFYITESTTEILEDDVLVSASVSSEADIPDSDLIRVVFEENARFYIRTIYDNGARYEDSEAGFHDLQQNMSVALKGEFVGDVFHADEIRMNKIV